MNKRHYSEKATIAQEDFLGGGSFLRISWHVISPSRNLGNEPTTAVYSARYVECSCDPGTVEWHASHDRRLPTCSPSRDEACEDESEMENAIADRPD
jgi:hypothetical protein